MVPGIVNIDCCLAAAWLLLTIARDISSSVIRVRHASRCLMTVHAAPSSVFFGEGAMAWALPRNGSFAALRSHNHCLQLLAAVLPRWASLRGIASDKPEQTRHEHESGRNYERQAPCWLMQSSTSARHRSVRLDVELKVELSKTTSMVFW